MKRGILFFNILAAIACGLGLARPDRLWSAVDPAFSELAIERLSVYSMPILEPADTKPSKLIKDRVFGLYGVRTVEGVVQNGENLDALLRRAGVSPANSQAFAQKFRTYFDMRTMRPGDKYQVWAGADGNLMSFSYRKSPVEIYEADWAGRDWRIGKVNIPVERKEAQISGDVSGSLWESFQRAGADADLTMGFVDLFSWDVDFAHESQPGDQFRAIYQTLYAQGQSVGNGRILAASYRDKDEVHYAFYWESGKTKGYYDMKGNSVRKSFLRSPVNFNRISSTFSMHRLHPISHDVKPHLGVDFAAPEGTPVWAVADGTVTFAGDSGGSGRMVTIRHASGYETSYLHLSRFGAGARSGARVSQGSVIGYVGSTGSSTGPHLDFRVRKSGVWVNPLKEKYTPGTPIPADELARYRQWTAEWMNRLEAVPVELKVARAR